MCRPLFSLIFLSHSRLHFRLLAPLLFHLFAPSLFFCSFRFSSLFARLLLPLDSCLCIIQLLSLLLVYCFCSAPFHAHVNSLLACSCPPFAAFLSLLCFPFDLFFALRLFLFFSIHFSPPISTLSYDPPRHDRRGVPHRCAPSRPSSLQPHFPSIKKIPLFFFVCSVL